MAAGDDKGDIVVWLNGEKLSDFDWNGHPPLCCDFHGATLMSIFFSARLEAGRSSYGRMR